MTSEELNDERMESVVKGAKKGDKSKVQIIVDNFQGLIKNSYDESIYEKVNLEKRIFFYQLYLKAYQKRYPTNWISLCFLSY